MGVSKILDSKAVKIMAVLLLFFTMIIGGRKAVGNGKLTLAVIILILTAEGIFLIARREFILNCKDYSINKFEEYRLAKRYQRNNIGKMYKNIILFMIPIIILSWSSINKYVVHKEYTERMNNNFNLAIEQLKDDESGLDELFRNITNDPLASMLINEGNTKDIVTIGLILMDTSKNITKAFTSLYIANDTLGGGEVITEENKAEVLDQLKEANAEIDAMYNNLMYEENSEYAMDKLISDIVRLNIYFRELNSTVINGLENDKSDGKKYEEMLINFRENIEEHKDSTTKALEYTIEVSKNKMIIQAVAFRVAWITAIWSVFRLIGIIKYFRLLKRYQRGI